MPGKWLGFVIAGVMAAPTDLAAQRQEVNRKIWVAPDGFVRIFNLAGSVRVEGWDQDSLSITGTAVMTGAGEFALVPGKQGARASLWSTQQKGTTGTLTVRLPRQAQLWVKTEAADVRVAEFEGGIDVMTSTGAVEISGRPRQVYVESIGGSVNLAVRTRSARVKTGSGKVTIRGRIDEALVSTVSGAIFLVGARVQQGRFESIDASISYRGALPAPGALEFVTHAGAVELALPAAAAGSFAITTVEGKFVDQLGVRMQPGKTKEREFNFILGGGVPETDVTVRTFRGAVLLRRDGARAAGSAKR